MKLTCPNALPLTRTWLGVTSTASAISGFETEKRPTGRSKLITRDCPTRTFTAMGSLFSLNDVLYDDPWPCAAELRRKRIKAANNKLARRVAVIERGECVCMIQ